MYKIIYLLMTLQGFSAYNISFIDATINTTITGNVNSEVQNVYRLRTAEIQHLNNSYIRVHFNASYQSSIRCPMHLVIRKHDQVQSINLPQHDEPRNLTFYSGARTLCMEEQDQQHTSIFVTVSSCSETDLSYTFTLKQNSGYLIQLNETIIGYNVSATAPIIYRFVYPEDVDFVTIFANSTTRSKTFVSIQPPVCPAHDELSNMKHTGHWHSMSRITSLIVQKKMYPDGFLLIFLPDGKSSSDSRINDASIYETITFMLNGDTQYKKALLPSLLIPILILVFVILIVYTTYSYFHYLYLKRHSDKELTPQHFQCLFTENRCDTNLRVLDFTTDKNLYKYLKANSYRYIWTILTIVFFYGLPVIILSLTIAKVSEETGDLDTCHFNYNCSYPLWIFTSFNHVYSCIGYILLGITFMVLVHLRAGSLVVNEKGMMGMQPVDPTLKWSCCTFPRVDLCRTGYGAYQNFGIYYALGFALAMVGVTKMTYNLCPNRDTTFFGLTFMFIMVLLAHIKIYSLRHPCMVTDNFTFVWIGLIILMVTSGYLIQYIPYQIGVSVFVSLWLQGTILILHSAGYAYDESTRPTPNAANDGETAINRPSTSRDNKNETVYSGSLEVNHLIIKPTTLFVHVFLKCNYKHLFCPEPGRRVFWPILRLVTNVGVLVFIWLMMTETHFTTRMFTLILANFQFEFIYYFIILKCCHQEYSRKTSWQPILYLFLAGFFGITSFVYLSKSIQAWELPPIIFQEYFTKCTMGIYDVLDMYHWTSAPAWFFTFMVILTADDTISRISTEMTVVF